jgi:hypothetical protein
VEGLSTDLPSFDGAAGYVVLDLKKNINTNTLEE